LFCKRAFSAQRQVRDAAASCLLRLNVFDFCVILESLADLKDKPFFKYTTLS